MSDASWSGYDSENDQICCSRAPGKQNSLLTRNEKNLCMYSKEWMVEVLRPRKVVDWSLE
jgi:hypothetical protein